MLISPEPALSKKHKKIGSAV